jgi:probable FeS assembly SUF system protein SufT
MTPGTDIELQRDCDAVEIPAGHSSRLGKGTRVQLTQSLGGSYTVQADGRLYRIADRDADALGVARPAEGVQQSDPAGQGASGEVTAEGVEQEVWNALRTCYDPEIPVNIVDLGLVYDLDFDDLPEGKRKVRMRMTLTAPGCGMGQVIAGDAQAKLLSLEGIDDAEVEVVWDPPWHPSMISAEGRRVLGLD